VNFVDPAGLILKIKDILIKRDGFFSIRVTYTVVIDLACGFVEEVKEGYTIRLTPRGFAAQMGVYLGVFLR